MAQFTYSGTEVRYYPDLALTAEPGNTYELQADPADGRWEAVTAPKAPKETKTNA